MNTITLEQLEELFTAEVETIGYRGVIATVKYISGRVAYFIIGQAQKNIVTLGRTEQVGRRIENSNTKLEKIGEFEMSPRKAVQKIITAPMPVVTEGQRKMTSIQFEEVTERPKVSRGRTKKENEFLGVVEEAAATGKTYKFELPVRTELDEKALKITLRLLREAGNEFEKTVSQVVDRETKKGVAIVTFWTKEKIRHTKKSES